ncbi:MAG: ArsR/SmtB family transcription factor [Candidatus Bathyarchaeia archaeon]
MHLRSKALDNETRLQILDSIERSISNPGVIASRLDRPRSTVEKHLRVLRSAGLVEKIPALNPEVD